MHHSVRYLYSKYQLNNLLLRYLNKTLQFGSFFMKGIWTATEWEKRNMCRCFLWSCAASMTRFSHGLLSKRWHWCCWIKEPAEITLWTPLDPIQTMSFKRPTSEMNLASGCPLFAPLNCLESNFAYVRDNTAFVTIKVDTQGLYTGAGWIHWHSWQFDIQNGQYIEMTF